MLKEKSAIVLNADKSSEPGSHWLAFYQEADKVEFLDSYGNPPESYGPRFQDFILEFDNFILKRCQGHSLYAIKAEATEIPETKTQVSETAPDEEEDEDVFTTKILKSAPVLYLNTVKNNFDFLKDNHSILSWTPEGEIVYMDQCIPRTNIVSLVTDLLRNRKKSPSKYKEFEAALKEMNILQFIIVNRKIFKVDPVKIYKDNSVKKPKSTKRMYAKRNTWITY
ncbi:hypothetical protein AVEN_153274-1 [Araneus ventricosus]|uniref:Uncharacterized protein n=1 Tax=Araneus ventricosus TaxID=182803 RepID=A0A4Y2ME39_ARAVE|nr:hypothetical protein AVEN_153274-1 [Araneus ventricosus]